MFLRNYNVLMVLLCSGYLAAEDITIQIPDGKIKGYVLSTVDGTTFYVFQGIPYAQPPINELRFQAPRPIQPWEGVVDATYEKSVCYQVSNNYTSETEDCLHINVYTPRDPSSGSAIPVMVWIYGGAFADGGSDMGYFGPHHYMDRDVILVSFNYRLGPLGFLSTGDSEIPGNAGLKDQNLALQWIKKNIQYFGGDPEKVTLFGQSAGAVSVIYQQLSPKSKGLFRSAIALSGTAIIPWGYQRNQISITYEIAKLIDPNADTDSMSTKELREFLLGVSAQQLKDAAYSKSKSETAENIQIQKGFFFAPVIEYEHEDALISKNMYESLESGEFNKVPIIIGMTSGEAQSFPDGGSEYMEYIGQTFDNNPSVIVPPDMHIQDEETQKKAAEEIQNLYLPVDGGFIDNPDNLTSYLEDQCFKRAIMKHAEIQSTMTDVYFYQFSYSGVLGGFVDEPVEGFSDKVRHGEDQNYYFSHNYTDNNSTDLSKVHPSDALVVRRFITLLTNFAKTLNPTPEKDELFENIIWPKVNPTYFPYLDIGSYSQVRLHPREATYSGWVSIYDKYGVKPLDTY